jgi:hypothetical protein
VIKGMFGANGGAAAILHSGYVILTAVIVGGVVLAHCVMRKRTLESVNCRKYFIYSSSDRPGLRLTHRRRRAAERDILSTNVIFVGALAVFVVIAGWEWYWHATAATAQRRRVARRIISRRACCPISSRA